MSMRLMHESFHPDDPSRFSRPWFAWANSLFAQFVMDWATRTDRAGPAGQPAVDTSPVP
jgi:meiotically up-regulated gene 157 (Mug157) protein